MGYTPTPLSSTYSLAFLDVDKSYPLEENNDQEKNSSVDDDSRPKCMTTKMTRKKMSLDPVALPIIPPLKKSATMTKEMRENKSD